MAQSSVFTVDVGAAAVDGVWRPNSCDDVQYGVVLTNITDNIKAVIEGCTIMIDAGSDDLSAVSIMGIGRSASVDLIGCTITANFNASLLNSAAVMLRSTSEEGSRISVQRSTVTAHNTHGSVQAISLAAFGLSHCTVVDSAINANCTQHCLGIRFRGRHVSIQRCSMFATAKSSKGSSRCVAFDPFNAPFSSVTLTESVFLAESFDSSKQSMGLHVVSGDRSTISVTQCNITVRGTQSQSIGLMVTCSKCGRFSVKDTLVHVLTEEGRYVTPYGIFIYGTTFGSHSIVEIQDSTVNATSAHHARPVGINSVSVPVLLVKNSHLVSSGTGSFNPSLHLFDMKLSDIIVTSTVLQSSSSSLGVIVASGAWDRVSLSVTSSVFIALKNAPVIVWPANFSGVSPQFFDNVTMTPPPSGATSSKPFKTSPGGSGVGPQVSLCLRDVRWSNGTAITEGPPELRAPTAAECWPVRTVDVGANAVDGVWRPSSCIDVQSGVVLTNITENLRAVIEGCTITIDAGTNESLSAVSIMGLGRSASVDIIDCIITAKIDFCGDSVRAATVMLRGVGEEGSRINVQRSTVRLRGSVGNAAAIKIPDSSRTDFTVVDSVIEAHCSCLSCYGISFGGQHVAVERSSVLVNSTRSATAMSITGRTRTVTMKESQFLSFSQYWCYGIFVRASFGDGSNVSITGCTVTSKGGREGRSTTASGLRLSSTTFGQRCRVSVLDTHVHVSTVDGYRVRGISAYRSTFGPQSIVEISDSTVNATTAVVVRAVGLQEVTIPALVIKNSRLIAASTLSQWSTSSGAIVGLEAWDGVSLTVVSSVLIADTLAPNATFVVWPANSSGVSPQSFDNVTMTTPPSGTSTEPFVTTPGGSGVGPQVSLCLRDVRWSNGTVITEGPPELRAPTAAECWPVRTVDVGVNAVDGVWRPSSCDDVQYGVVLTNITDNIKAVIEGCTIMIDAGANYTLSAVSIMGIGRNASVDLIGCTITAKFSFNADLIRGATVMLRGVGEEGSRILIRQSSIIVHTSGSGASAATIIPVDSGLSDFTVVDSVIDARCDTTSCYGVWFGGQHVTVERSSVTATSGRSSARALYVRGNENAVSRNVTVTQSTLTAVSPRWVSLGIGIRSTFGDGSTISVTRCTITSKGGQVSQYAGGFGLSFSQVTCGRRCRFSVSDTRVHVTAVDGYRVRGISAYRSTFGPQSIVEIRDSTVNATAASTTAVEVRAVGLQEVSIPALVIKNSRLIVASTLPQWSASSGVIVGLEAWDGVSLTVVSSVLIADTPAPNATFVVWPANFSGVSPQSFDNVTMTPLPSGTSTEPFKITPGGSGVGPQVSLCLRDVRWSNGTAITEGPPELRAPTAAECWPVRTVDVGASAVDGVWRPSSCDNVQYGVVLTNITDNIKAVIEGCTITIDAGTNYTLSAVSIMGIGRNASVDLISCTITTRFNSGGDGVRAVTVMLWGTSEEGSRISIQRSSITVHNALGTAAAIKVPKGSGLSDCTVVDSKINAHCDRLGTTYGIWFGGQNVTVVRSTVFSNSSMGTAQCVFIRGTGAPFQSVAVTQSVISADAWRWRAGLYVGGSIGDGSTISVTGCTITSQGKDARWYARSFGLSISYATFGRRCRFSVSDTRVRVTAVGDGRTHGVSVYRSTFGPHGIVEIQDSTFNATAALDARSVSLEEVSIPALVITNSRLIADGAVNAPLRFAVVKSSDIIVTSTVLWSSSSSGAIVGYGAWDRVSLTVASSVLIADTPALNATFVVWPANFSGVSPQSFYNVTMTPLPSGTSSEPFSSTPGGSGVGPQVSLCLRDVRWSNGTAITEGPPELREPTAAECWPDVRTIDVGIAAIDGVWSPTSCFPVMDGVVLTNISDNVKAVIEGCTIAVNDVKVTSLRAAVFVTDLGDNSSVELRGCTITVAVRAPIGAAPPHYAGVRLGSKVPFGRDGGVFIDDTTCDVSSYASAVRFDDSFSARDGFRFGVTRSRLTASCLKCKGVWISTAAFGHRTNFEVEKSSVSVMGASWPVGIDFGKTSFGNHSAVKIFDTTVSVKTNINADGLATNKLSFGDDCTLSIISCTITVLTEVGLSGLPRRVSGIFASRGFSFGRRGLLTITRSSVVCVAQDSPTTAIFLGSDNYGTDCPIELLHCTASASMRGFAAVAVWVVPVDISAIKIHNSTLQTTSRGVSEHNDVLMLPSLRSASVTVSSSVFISSSSFGRQTVINARGSRWDNASIDVSNCAFEVFGSAPRFVVWPDTITGISPVSFDNVTVASAKGVAVPFQIGRNGAGLGPHATLCLRNVTWADGSEITPPKAFPFPASARYCTRPIVTPTATPTFPPTETVQPTGTWSMVLSTTKTRAATLSHTQPPTSSLAISVSAPAESPGQFSSSSDRPAALSSAASSSPHLSMPASSSTRRSSALSSPASSVQSSGARPVVRTRSLSVTLSRRITATALPPRPAAVPARTLPPAVETVATTSSTAGGAVAAFVGSGVAGATQAGRTLAVLQLVACSSGRDSSGATTNGGNQTQAHEVHNDGAAAPFPQALMPWVKIGSGAAGWARGVVIGNAAAVVLLFLVAFGVWAAAARGIAHLAARNPDSWAARVGADPDAPAAANAAGPRVSRLMRFPGVAATVPVGFAVDGFVGEAVGLMRHGVEGHAGAGPADVIFGAAAVIAACVLWALLLYTSLVVVPRHVSVTPAPHTDSPAARRRSSTPPSTAQRLLASLYRHARSLRDGDFVWIVNAPPKTLASNDQTFAAPPTAASIVATETERLEEDADAATVTVLRGQEETDNGAELGRYLFAARWAVLFAPLHRRALFYPALDVAASVAIAIARGLRPRTADGCQRALAAVATVQVALLVMVLLLRPFIAPLKTAVTAVACALLAFSAVVGAVAGISGSARGEEYGVVAGYLATAAGVVLLANPALSLWRVVEAKVATRRAAAPHLDDLAEDHPGLEEATAPLLPERSQTPSEPKTSFSQEMVSMCARAVAPGPAPGWVLSSDPRGVRDVMAQVLDAAEAEPPVDDDFDPLDAFPADSPGHPVCSAAAADDSDSDGL